LTQLLDILIPAYNNLCGIKRILNFIPTSVYPKLRIVISDDSNNHEIENYLIELSLDLKITYVSGPKNGAINNWNSLLQYVESDFFVLLHHDEAIVNFKFLEYLSNIQERRKFALILPYKVQSKNKTWTIIDSCLQKTFLEKYMNYLPYINFLGPTSSLVVSKHFSVIKFSNDLNWLVDCYWYYQVLSDRNVTVEYNFDFSIHSYYYSDSITWSSNGAVKSLFIEEVKLIKKKLKDRGSIVYIYLVKILYKLAKICKNSFR